MIEFDRRKSKSNEIKHGFLFSEVNDFDWKNAIIQPDLKKDYGENRFLAMGYIGLKLCTLSFTERGDNIRVISLRPTSRKE